MAFCFLREAPCVPVRAMPAVASMLLVLMAACGSPSPDKPGCCEADDLVPSPSPTNELVDPIASEHLARALQLATAAGHEHCPGAAVDFIQLQGATAEPAPRLRDTKLEWGYVFGIRDDAASCLGSVEVDFEEEAATFVEGLAMGAIVRPEDFATELRVTFTDLVSLMEEPGVFDAPCQVASVFLGGDLFPGYEGKRWTLTCDDGRSASVLARTGEVVE